MTYTAPTQPPYRQLRRPTSDRMVAGVASGLGRYFDVDPTLVRVILAVATILTGGVALLTYPVMWFLMPEESPGAPPWPGATGTAPQPGATGAPVWPGATGAAPTRPDATGG
ncbi:PspC domain-containing protein [Micromonospora sp. CPCC 206060]|uniref:PspC domain-containing protein n=1 Tax=Micromonospora sp. CPCC 206060 TaxID=3122406 RepID=UPI002FEEA4AD